MKNRTVPRVRAVTGVAALALAGSLALAGCSSDDSSSPSSSSPSASAAASAPQASCDTSAKASTPTTAPADQTALDKVTVKGKAGSKPTVKVPKGTTVTGPVSSVVTKGTGAALKKCEILVVKTVTVSGADGSQVSDGYATPTYIQLNATTLQPVLVAAFDGQKVGTRVLFAVPSTGTTGKAATYVSELEVTGTVPSRASGAAVTPPAGLPSVTLASDGTPGITIPAGYKAPSDLVSQTLIKGSGKKVGAKDTVVAQYTGWTTDGKSFDSSWTRGQPAAFSLSGGVIKGWTQGLTGQTVGSQVLLVIPAKLAYGNKPPSGSNIAKGATLIFVIDILGTAAAS